MSMDLEISHGKKGSTISIELIGADALIAKLNQIDKAFRGEAGRSMVSAGAMIINGETQKNINETFSKKNTGGLKNSVATVVSENKPEARVEVWKIYARIQEFGGTIKPVKAKMLHWEEDGKDIFAKSVTLPPRPYFRPAIENNEDKIVKAMSDAADVYLRSV
jgi:HK97 gp10 family phage protein